MGIDKDNVRLVIHLEVPGSLENYLQEAGRAGRDREDAECILLYDEQDIETQFRLGAASRLSPQDIREVLKGLRALQRKGSDQVVLTGAELLRDERLRLGFDNSDPQAETKVRTAVAWLERGGLIERNQNHTRVFQGRPRVRSLDEARRRIARLKLSQRQQRRWLAIIEALLQADPMTVSAPTSWPRPAPSRPISKSNRANRTAAAPVTRSVTAASTPRASACCVPCTTWPATASSRSPCCCRRCCATASVTPPARACSASSRWNERCWRCGGRQPQMPTPMLVPERAATGGA